ncbi:2-phospho-L-lactate guanylyltransferase [Nocardioides coralli]|uniref:2-phospho-L-lactate guanylyltransferase n=1 Tax=Nocardioides coralli TaxID=2872154 RepID=UPI001CA441DB|nr:2-phospho-L-lactate guanylyltransferase [Nocardioides coralli]QZY28180.1 2-phospho-L-lactate guanylyltransferase [Nocardioides coralli]
MEPVRHVVIVPVKSPAVGKSRLRVPGPARVELARAFALDVLAAAESTSTVAEVVVATSDPEVAQTVRALGHRVVAEGNGLNHALRAAAAAARGWWPDLVPVALCADLPCLTAHDLGSALAQVTADGASFVVDATGEGTTLYGAGQDHFAPCFGPGSSAAHAAAGARPVDGALATLRRDVDDEADLAEAVRLGPGRHTREALALLS